ncbi:Fur family transcriptional regulator [Geothrix sp. PMB-07]|uniref:Fur family transcriptional regulator n=1 Tax=Geothrix sp. PMB-07 TaxID=3068640 RepID=UPI0027421B39|nr:transcriptional repressor [Geothrix sp. PMB-07]WLT33503.1 transcriptional repressor [Geothrix sp. PMB-07]
MGVSNAHPPSTPSLRAAGMRQTPQREGILRVLKDSDRPMTVEEIWERMPERRSGLPTVYRNLERFVREGWAESILGADQVMRFVRCDSRHHHHHLQCERCGRTAEVDACGLEESLKNLEALSGFQITRHQLMLFGLCGICGAETAANAEGHQRKTGTKDGAREIDR